MNKTLAIVLSMIVVVPALSGCVSLAEINSSFRRIDMAWDLDYQRTEDEFRARVVDAPYPVVYEAMKKAFLDLGMPLAERSLKDGMLVARNAAPNPLTIDEWKEVRKVEEPRMKEIGGWYFVFKDDPKAYIVTVAAMMKALGTEKTLIVIEYELDAPELRVHGVEPSKRAPPTAVRLASLKLWASLNNRLSEVKLPEARRRKPIELEV